MLRDLIRGCYHTVRETMPDSVEECGFWMSGFCWAFGLHWVILILVTWSVCSTRGGC